MAQPAQQKGTDCTFYMTEIPKHFDKQSVVNVLKEKLELENEYIITTGNFLNA